MHIDCAMLGFELECAAVVRLIGGKWVLAASGHGMCLKGVSSKSN